MPWARIDDTAYDHPKFMAVSLQAVGVYFLAISYCNRHLTDGLIHPRSLRSLRCTPRLAAELVAAELWEADPLGYRVHDFLVFSDSRAQVEASRAIAARRAAMNRNPSLQRAIRERDGNTCQYCGVEVDWRDRRGPSGGTYDHVVPLSAGGQETVGNLVVACRDCNGRKGPRTPDEAGMVLRSGRHLDGTKPFTGTPSHSRPVSTDSRISRDEARTTLTRLSELVRPQ